MSEWSDGYRQAIANIAHLAHSRGVPLPDAIRMLLADLEGDALVIEREQDNRIRRRRLRAAREAELPLDDRSWGDYREEDGYPGSLLPGKKPPP